MICYQSPRQTFRVYLAGKIYKNDWRHALVPGLRDHTWSDGDLKTSQFFYVGPFFVSCDHGCYHGDGAHGVGARGHASHGSKRRLNRAEVRHLCLAAVSRCDYLVAYITAPDCYGTIAEIQYAHMVGKQVFIVFAPGLASKTNNQFWFVSDLACRVFYDVDEAGLNRLLSKIVEGGNYGV